MKVTPPEEQAAEIKLRREQLVADLISGKLEMIYDDYRESPQGNMYYYCTLRRINDD